MNNYISREMKAPNETELNEFLNSLGLNMSDMINVSPDIDYKNKYEFDESDNDESDNDENDNDENDDESEKYNYKIIALKKIDNGKYLYVVEEKNNDNFNNDIHYYFKYYENGYIVMDHEIQSYNPYFEISIYKMELNDDIVQVEYSEKYKCCTVDIKIDRENKHKVYMKSQPHEFSRDQNESTRNHEIGTIVKFIKAGKEMKMLSYYE